ncbi:MAG TPA: tail fiber domain-containing protein [Chryseosolibacter sp.]
MKKIFATLAFSICGLGFVAAQVPRTISYQGFYTDASGNPVNGSPHKVTFRFFDAVSNAENTSLAREVENITINKGVISVMIGAGDPSHTTGPDNAALPLDVWTQSYKVQVFVDGNSIGDQVPLTTVPYAFVAGSVDGANITGTVATTKISGTLPGTQVGTGINASNITTGTLNPTLFTDGSIPGTKLALDINATNIASGTLSDSRLESTIDVTGVNTTGNITTGGGIHVGGTSDPGIDNLVVDGTITGNGSGISSLNASNLTTGTVSDSRLESTLDVAGVNTSGNVTTAGGIHVGGTSDPGVDNLLVDGTITGNGSGISAINASNITTGTISDARLETNVDVSGYVTTVGGIHVGGTSNPGIDNLVVDGTISGNGSGITSLTAANLTGTNTLPAGVLPTTVPLGNGSANTLTLWTGTGTVGSDADLSWNGTTNTLSALNFSGNGSSLTSLTAANITGTNTLPTAVLPTTVPLGNGAANRIAVWTGTGAVSSNANLAWDNTNSRLGVGIAAPTTSLYVRHGNGIATNGISVENSATGNPWSLYVANNDELWLVQGGAEKGEFNPASGAYTAVSDRRLKKDFSPVESVLANVMQLKPLSYRFVSQASTAPKSIGFVAQEVKDLFPSVVNYSAENDLHTMDYAAFGVIAIKAIQEQQEMIDLLRKELQALKTEMNALVIERQKNN